jgi:hypothetical protein
MLEASLKEVHELTCRVFLCGFTLPESILDENWPLGLFCEIYNYKRRKERKKEKRKKDKNKNKER